MNHFFSSGHAIDLVIAVLAFEALIVRGLLRRQRALPMPTLVAGLCLLLAWRVSLAGGPWFGVALPLCAAGLAHGVDLWRRWSEP
jgi:hypothetical protein